MKIFRHPAIQFAIGSLFASLPITWAYWGLHISDNTFGAYMWHVMPALAAVFSGLSAWIVNHFTSPQGFGPWRGAFAALLALVTCCFVAHPTLILPALVFVGWLVALLGAGMGWLIGRRLGPNNSFKPKPLRGSA
jgi:hypothetical protein